MQLLPVQHSDKGKQVQAHNEQCQTLALCLLHIHKFCHAFTEAVQACNHQGTAASSAAAWYQLQIGHAQLQLLRSDRVLCSNTLSSLASKADPRKGMACNECCLKQQEPNRIVPKQHEAGLVMLQALCHYSRSIPCRRHHAERAPPGQALH
jgi:hypothetical protein